MLLFYKISYLIISITIAGVSRAPAVLDSSCDLNVEASNSRPVIEIHQEQCKRVRQCMNSAEDSEIPDLKKLEALVCHGNLIPVTTSIPKLEINKAEFNVNSRDVKMIEDEKVITLPLPSSTVIDK